uniref:Uncharacterized protein n=1 Tax=Anguilla anguilla TaxID=7936 RepID=A0A0E9PAX2_ANGAN
MKRSENVKPGMAESHMTVPVLFLTTRIPKGESITLTIYNLFFSSVSGVLGTFRGTGTSKRLLAGSYTLNCSM